MLIRAIRASDNTTGRLNRANALMKRFRRLVRESNMETIQPFGFAAAAKLKLWDKINVTLLGDALYYMSQSADRRERGIA